MGLYVAGLLERAGAFLNRTLDSFTSLFLFIQKTIKMKTTELNKNEKQVLSNLFDLAFDFSGDTSDLRQSLKEFFEGYLSSDHADHLNHKQRASQVFNYNTINELLLEIEQLKF